MVKMLSYRAALVLRLALRTKFLWRQTAHWFTMSASTLGLAKATPLRTPTVLEYMAKIDENSCRLQMNIANLLSFDYCKQ